MIKINSAEANLFDWTYENAKVQAKIDFNQGV